MLAFRLVAAYSLTADNPGAEVDVASVCASKWYMLQIHVTGVTAVHLEDFGGVGVGTAAPVFPAGAQEPSLPALVADGNPKVFASAPSACNVYVYDCTDANGALALLSRDSISAGDQTADLNTAMAALGAYGPYADEAAVAAGLLLEAGTLATDGGTVATLVDSAYAGTTVQAAVTSLGARVPAVITLIDAALVDATGAGPGVDAEATATTLGAECDAARISLVASALALDASVDTTIATARVSIDAAKTAINTQVDAALVALTGAAAGASTLATATSVASAAASVETEAAALILATKAAAASGNSVTDITAAEDDVTTFMTAFRALINGWATNAYPGGAGAVLTAPLDDITTWMTGAGASHFVDA